MMRKPTKSRPSKNCQRSKKKIKRRRNKIKRREKRKSQKKMVRRTKPKRTCKLLISEMEAKRISICGTRPFKKLLHTLICLHILRQTSLL